MKYNPLPDDGTLYPNNVLYYRELLHLSQKDLGELSGKTPQTIGSIERGEKLARPSTRRAIAQALKTPVEEVFPHDHARLKRHPSPAA